MKSPLRPAASLIAVHRGSERLLWVRRSEANPFLGGFHSFPGGRHSAEDGPLSDDADSAPHLVTMARCAARETFEETGLLVGFAGSPPPRAEQERVRREVLAGAPFWSAVESWGLSFEPDAVTPCGRWITPHFSRARFNTNFFLHDAPSMEPPDVWPGELESGAWVYPKEALSLWEGDRIVLAMPTLHTIQVLAAGMHDLPARLHEIPEANGVASRCVHVRPAITMIPLRTDTIPPATHTNAVVVGDGDVVIVDPGTPDHDELVGLDRVVKEALQPGGRVLAVLLTHRHRDHVAGVEVVRERYRAPVWAHHLVGDRVWLDRELHEGEVIELSGRHPRRLRVLETPGHSRSHLAFHEETSNTLIAGDLVSGLGTVVIDPPEGNLRDYLASLTRVRSLDLRTLIPGHGPPNRGANATLDALIRHRQMRESRVLRALEGGPLPEDALRDEVYSDTPGADPALALRTLRAHLEKLEGEGLTRRIEDGRIERIAGEHAPGS